VLRMILNGVMLRAILRVGNATAALVRGVEISIDRGIPSAPYNPFRKQRVPLAVCAVRDVVNTATLVVHTPELIEALVQGNPASLNFSEGGPPGLSEKEVDLNPRVMQILHRLQHMPPPRSANAQQSTLRLLVSVATVVSKSLKGKPRSESMNQKIV
jgi:hypothetical protein